MICQRKKEEAGYQGKEEAGYQGKEKVGCQGKEEVGCQGKEEVGEQGREEVGEQGKENLSCPSVALCQQHIASFLPSTRTPSLFPYFFYRKTALLSSFFHSTARLLSFLHKTITLLFSFIASFLYSPVAALPSLSSSHSFAKHNALLSSFLRYFLPSFLHQSPSPQPPDPGSCHNKPGTTITKFQWHFCTSWRVEGS